MPNSVLKNYKSITKNFIYLAIIRFFNIVSKFLLVSYLIRVLGEKTFGLLTWSEAILQYFIVFINFGFNIFGAKLIVENRGNQESLRNIISSIFTIKAIFFLFSFLILFFLYSFNSFNANYYILLILMLATVGDLIFPIWYFQGLENLKPLSISVAVAKITLIIGTVLFVTSSSDIYTYVYIFTFSHILMGVLGVFSLKKHLNKNLFLPNVTLLKPIIKRATYYFLGNISMLIFNALTIFLIGVYVSMEKVTMFDISLKIVFIFILPFEILQAVIMPNIAKTRNKKQLQKLIIISLFVGLFFFLLINIFGEDLLSLFAGKTTTKYYPVLQQLSYLAIVVPATFMIGQCGLVAFNQDKRYNYSLITISILFFIVVALLIFLKQLNFNNLIVVRVLTDYVLFIFILIQAFRCKIFSL